MTIDDFFKGRKDEWEKEIESIRSVDHLLGLCQAIELEEGIPNEVVNYCHDKIYQRIYQLI